MEAPKEPITESPEVAEQAVRNWLARWPNQEEGLRVLSDYHRAWTAAIRESSLPAELVAPPYELPEPPLPATTAGNEARMLDELGAAPSEAKEPLSDEDSLQLLEAWLARWPTRRMATDALFEYLKEWIFKTGRKAADYDLGAAIDEFIDHGDIRDLPEPPDAPQA